jgi:hypothetical protein
MIGKVINNVIGNAAVTGSGSHIGQGISVNALGAGTITATVTGNTVRQVALDSVFFGQAASGTPVLNLKVQNNTFRTDSADSIADAVDLTAGLGDSDGAVLCLDMATNTLSANTRSEVLQTFGGSGFSFMKLVGLNSTFDNDTTAIANFVGSSGATTPTGVNTSVTPAPSAALITIANAGQIVGTSGCGVTFP